MAETKLLIIDDDPDACETLSDIFQDKGYIVEAASTGKEAIAKVKKTEFNAALIDIKLPDLDGTTLLKKFKSMYPDIVCIIITGHAALQNAINALKEGASGYFVKPLVIDEVVLRIEEALDKQHLQQEVRESEEKYRHLYESSIDGITSFDMQGNFVDANKAFLNMFRYTLEEIRKLSYQKLTPKKWHKQDEDIVKNQIMVKGYSDEYEKEYLRKDGTLFPASLILWLIKDKQGKPMGIWGIVRDITERKLAEEELKKHRDHLEEMIKERTTELQKTINLMAGREVRMAELKKAIQELRKQIKAAGLTPVVDDPLKETVTD